MENNRPKLPTVNITPQNLPLRGYNVPSVAQMASNLIETTKATIEQYKATGAILANDTKVKERLSICQQCAFFETFQKRCTKCGCFMQAKTYLEAATCPIGKW